MKFQKMDKGDILLYVLIAFLAALFMSRRNEFDAGAILFLFVSNMFGLFIAHQLFFPIMDFTRKKIGGDKDAR